MPVIYLSVTAFGSLLVLNALRPVRHEPFSVFSFFAGWYSGELTIQHIVWQAVATVIFGIYGAFDAWEGWLGLGLAIVSWIGLLFLTRQAFATTGVVTKALAEASGGPLAAVPDPKDPLWGTWWRLALAIPYRPRSIERIKNIDYWGDGIRRHRLDILRSRTTAPKGAPVLIYIHGGAWVTGDKREQGIPKMHELVSRGWVCVAINYRLSPKGTWPDHLVDCKRAVAWVREHISDYGGDPSFIALSGGSAGGHLCAMVALTPGDREFQPGFEDLDTHVDAAVPFYGVMDMTGTAPSAGKYGPGLRELLEKRVTKVTSTEDPELFRRGSPTYRVHADAPPFFVLHGTNDTLVPVDVARIFVKELRAVSKAPVAYAEIPYAQHAFDVLASIRCRATTAGAVAFLDAVRHGVARPSTSTSA